MVSDVPESVRFPVEVRPTFLFKPMPQRELLMPLMAKVPVPALNNAWAPELNQMPSLDVDVPLIARLPAVLEMVLAPKK